MVIALIAIGMLAVSATALAAKPDKPSPSPDLPVTCAEWGPGWVLGAWDESAQAYVVPGLSGCIDILEDHQAVTAWTVSWNLVPLRPMKGVLIRFEGMPGRIVLSDQVVVKTASGSMLMTTTQGPDPLGFKFVAMRHSADRYDVGSTFTITPLP